MNEALLTIFAPLLSVVVTIAVGVLSRKANEWFNLKNEKMLRDALHQSAENAVRYATTRGTMPDAVINVAADYVKSKNADTLKKLRVSDKGLEDVIQTKVPPVAQPER